MRRILVAAIMLLACGSAAIVWAVEANSGGPVDHGMICPSGETEIQMVFSAVMYAPSGYTLWSNDGTEFRFIRRFADGVRDTIGILVPAGNSLLVPAPSAIVKGDSFTHTIFIGGHTDTVYALPWYR